MKTNVVYFTYVNTFVVGVVEFLVWIVLDFTDIYFQ